MVIMIMCLSSEIAYFLSHILSFIHTQCFVMKILKHKVYYKLDEIFHCTSYFTLLKFWPWSWEVIKPQLTEFFMIRSFANKIISRHTQKDSFFTTKLFDIMNFTVFISSLLVTLLLLEQTLQNANNVEIFPKCPCGIWSLMVCVLHIYKPKLAHTSK